METLYQILDRYFSMCVNAALVDETIDFTLAKRQATYTKRGGLGNVVLSITAPATWKALGTSPKHSGDENGITTLVRTKPKNYTVLSPEKAVYRWARQVDRNIMSGAGGGRYELRMGPLVFSYDSLEAVPRVDLEGRASFEIGEAIEKILKARVRY